jgi:hypothetical protein
MDWQSLSPGGWHFWNGCRARVALPSGGLERGSVVDVMGEADGSPGLFSVCPVGGGDPVVVDGAAMVPEMDWSNLPDPVDALGILGADDQRPRAFFLTVFGRLTQTGTSARTGEPIMGRDNRVWAWHPTFAEAFRVVDGNITDIHEYSYEYAQIEEVPSGLTSLPRREWWWRWDTKADRWLKAVRPDDYRGVVCMSIG